MEEMIGLNTTAEMTNELAKDMDFSDEKDVATLNELNDHAESLIEVIEAPLEE